MKLTLEDMKTIIEASKKDLIAEDYFMESEHFSQLDWDEEGDDLEIIEEYFPEIVKIVLDRILLRIVFAENGKEEADNERN